MGDRKKSSFPTTRWSLLARAGNKELAAEARKAELAEFLRIYMPALRDFLIRSRRIEAQEADELTQAFVTEQILQRDLLAKAKPAAGKFRGFLCVSLKNFATSVHRRSVRGPSPVSLDQAPEPAWLDTPDTEFARLWARRVVAESLRRMQAKCAAGGEDKLWRLFHGRVVAPLYEDSPATGYTELIRELDLPSPTVAANLLVKAKRWYQSALREVIGEYTSGERDSDEEIRQLWRCLTGSAK